MNYPLKSKPRKENNVAVVSIIIITFILFFSLFFFQNFFRSVSYSVARPLWSITDNMIKPFSKVKGFFTFKNSLIDQNLALQDEVSALKLRQIDYDSLSKENQDIKNELGRKTGIHIVAGVLSKPPRSPFDTLVIDAGSVEGIILGNKVYISENIIIGTVTSVTPHTSLVQLFSTGGVKHESLISRTGATFTVTGRGGANFELEVPKETDIVWGDVLMFPGLDSSIMGNVYYIDSNSQSSFKTIYIRIPGNVFSIKEVFVD